MGFFIAMLIVMLACLAITYKTLAGYGHLPIWAKLLILILLIVAWFSPMILHTIRNYKWLDGTAYAVIAKGSYFLMGLAFILFMLLFFRDVIWYIVYYVSHNSDLSPDNVRLLHRNNLITVVLALLISLYSVYEANKTPTVKDINITDKRIKENTRLVVASDLHIDRATPLWQIRQIIGEINKQNPDYVLLVGDVIDDVPDNLKGKMEELKKIKAKKIYLSFGNHEYYNAPIKWMIEFTHIGFEVLHNTGNEIEQTGIYLAGVPDASSATVNYKKALFGATDDNYKILMSHSPRTIKDEENKFDLQVSGHTHGGQIFPFHFLAKEANGFLAGMYDDIENGHKLYITRGAGYWGPPMRLLAPSDITVINLKAGKDA